MRFWDFLWKWAFFEFGGGSSSGSSQFKAQGTAPSFDYQSAMGLNQMAIGADVASYAMSDQDFANRYPDLQKAYNQYQANLGQQVGLTGQGQAQQSQLMSGLANQIAGRMAAPTTQNIQNIQNAAATAGAAVQPIYGMGAQQAGLAQPLVGAGQQMMGAAQIPYQLGRELLTEPIDPQTQQQMMHAGLGSVAGALGGASLGQGMAGQSAAARQLGLNTLQYGQAMRGEAMQDINQYSSIMGAGGQMIGLGGQQLGAGAQTYGLGAQTAATSGGLYNTAQQAQEQYGMDTAQMAGIFGGLQNQQATNMLGNIANSGQLFQKRPFGLGGTNLAQAELSQAGAYNSFQQANYATMNGIAFNQAQMNAQQQQLQAQQNANMTGAMISTGTTAATTAATVAGMAGCWIAQAVYGTADNRWKTFRHWLMNKAPAACRRAYIRYGQSFASKVRRSPLLRLCLKLVMDPIIERTIYVQY